MSRVVAVDCGTMFFQVAEQGDDGSVNIKSIRNAFVELPEDEDVEEVLNRNEWQWIKDGKKYYILGEDSLKVANIFPGKVELRRPMESGVLNRNEEKKNIVMAEIINSAVGKPTDKDSLVCICVSSESVDDSVDSVFHRNRLSGMFSRLGWNVHVIEEGQAVVLSERPTIIEKDEHGNSAEVPYSGIGLSFGAGRTNCVLTYKGLKIIGMSCARCGDWVDNKVAEATNTPISQVTRKKERELNFDNLEGFEDDDDVLFALNAYYEELIRFVFEKFAVKFGTVKSQFEYPLPIVVAGGTSMPKGFCNKIKEVVSKLDLPFDIKDVVHASEPRNSVVKGCLTSAMIAKRRLDKKEEE